MNIVEEITKKLNEVDELLFKLGKELEDLKERDQWLSCLEAAGVDNWEGYDYAKDLV